MSSCRFNANREKASTDLIKTLHGDHYPSIPERSARRHEALAKRDDREDWENPERCNPSFPTGASEASRNASFWISGLSRPVLSQESQKIPVHDAFDIVAGVAAAGQHVGKFAEVGDGLEVGRALFAAETAVEVGADPDMAGVTGELADVVDVVDLVFESHAEGLGTGLADFPAGHDHPGVEDRAEDGAAVEEGLDLLVAELASVGDEGSAVLVAGPDGAVEVVEGFPEAIVAQVGGVEDDVEAFHFREELAALGAEAAGRVGPLGVAARAVVSGAEGAKPLGVGLFEVAGGADRVGPFQAEDIADGGVVGRVVGPEVDVAVEALPVGDGDHLASFFHRAVPGELALSLGPGDFGAVPAGQGVVGGHVAGDLRGHAEADLPSAHVGEGDDSVASVGLIGFAPLSCPDLGDRPGDVPVPVQGVHA